MQTSAIRVEVIRFSLLVVLTVALLSVAIRLASHSTPSHPGAQPGPHPTASALPAGSVPPSAAAPLATTMPSAVTTPNPSSSSSAIAPQTRAAGGSSSGPTAQPVLPVTGYDAAVKLAGLSMILIGAGALTVRASRRERGRGRLYE